MNNVEKFRFYSSHDYAVSFSQYFTFMNKNAAHAKQIFESDGTSFRKALERGEKFT